MHIVFDVCTNDHNHNAQFTEDKFQLRTPSSYEYHCTLLSGITAEADSTTYGIRYRSALNKISHYHVNTMQMPQDVMHVLFEGVLAMETHMMLCTFLKKKYLSLSDINDRVKSFEFGNCEAKNRPPKPFKEKDFDSNSSRLHLSGK